MKQISPDLPIYTADLETDPFAYGDLPEPFVGGIYDGTDFTYHWDVEWERSKIDMGKRLASLPPGIVYLHNGGKFDLFYLMDWLTGEMMIVNGRIVRATSIWGHEFRDSYAIIPTKLAQYKKDDIDYNKLKKTVRYKHREEIVKYLKSDCVYLHELVTAFRSQFGLQVTIGTTAMKELKKVHSFDMLSEEQDADLRARYYYGGRVQCFRKGVIRGNLQVYDVNSMYPYVMREMKHPVGRISSETKKIGRDTAFVSVIGENRGAFPIRTREGISFDCSYGEFHVPIHEYRMALLHKLFTVERVTRAVNFEERKTFKEFVDKFYSLRIQAKNANHLTNVIFYKLILNSAYGKFAQNPENYYDYCITDFGDNPGKWEICEGHPRLDAQGNLYQCPYAHRDYIMDDRFVIWSKRSASDARHNVATAASITGGARAVLMDGIARSTNPIYCDTDSIICEGLEGVKIDSSELGAWKLEKEGSFAAIGGKKLYAVFDDSKARIELERQENSNLKLEFDGSLCVKQANKGVRISPEEIMGIATGQTVTYQKDSPSLRLDGSHMFITRRIRML